QSTTGGTPNPSTTTDTARTSSVVVIFPADSSATTAATALARPGSAYNKVRAVSKRRGLVGELPIPRTYTRSLIKERGISRDSANLRDLTTSAVTCDPLGWVGHSLRGCLPRLCGDLLITA